MTRSGPVGSGLLVVDKPAGITSHDVVARTRRLAGTRRVGHAGTLDPAATGVLVLGIEKGTKLLGHLALGDKDYTATIRLGQATSTDDAEGETVGGASAAAVSDEALQAGLAALTGTIQQVPSSVSAIKVDGRRAYARVRAGEQVVLAARTVTVSSLRATGSRLVGDLLDVDVDVTCSSGTYVRALARDLGESLGVGGHLTALRRTRVGPYGTSAARTLDELEQLATHGALPLIALPVAVESSFRRVDVDEATARAVGHGHPLALDADEADVGDVRGVFDPDGEVVALMAPRDGQLRALVVFIPS